MKKLIAGAVCALATCGLPTLAAAEEGGFTLTGPAKIAMLYISPRNDGGWTQAFDEARQRLEGEIGQKIQYVESVPDFQVFMQIGLTGATDIGGTDFDNM